MTSLFVSDRRIAGRAAATAWALLALCACGGAEFARAPDAGQYKALIYNYKVSVVDALDELEQPLDVVGTFARTTRSEDDRKSVAKGFVAQARKYGCDAVAEVAYTVEDKKGLRTVKVLGKDGRGETKQEEFTTKLVHWTGKCVRTAVAGVDEAVLARRYAAAGGGEVPQGGSSEPVAMPQGRPGAKAVVEPGQLGPETASQRAARELCQRLDKYSDGFLRAWKDKLRAPRPEPMDALDAWSELQFQVTGAGGFWRKMVPQNWFGCGTDAENEQCKKLAAAGEREFRKWEQLQESIGNVGPATAGSFVRRNQERLIEYLDSVVPETASLSGMEGTPFYQKHLK